MTPGEIRDVSYPNRDPTGPPDTVRPVLILGVSPLGLNEDAAVMVAHFTADHERVRNPRIGDLLIEDDYLAVGLKCPSVARCRQATNIDLSRIGKCRGRVDPETLERARQIVRDLLNS